MTELTPEQEAEKLHAMACDYYLKRHNTSMAYDLWLRCIELDPTRTEYRTNLATVCVALGRHGDTFRDMACNNAQVVARMRPDVAVCWGALAEFSLNAYKYTEAIAAFERALQLNPLNERWWCLRGFSHNRIGELVRARECYEEAIKIDPDMGQAHFLLSMLAVGADFDPWKQAYHGEKGFTAKRPATMALESCWNSAHGYLALGDYLKGFEYFEGRLRLAGTITGGGSPLMRFSQPRWRGEKDCTILVHPEMGLGDSFLMLRYLPVVAKKFNVKVIFECLPQMIDLVRHSFPDVEIHPFGNINGGFDYHMPMMSLPFYCKTRSDTVPWDGPYIKAEPHKIAEWKEKPFWAREQIAHGVVYKKMNVGICWAGGKRAYNAGNHEIDKRRSVPFDKIKPLLDLPGINWISLQAENDSGLPNPGIRSFSDTAAIIHLLDAVVSVDTSVINLAGAMGKKTWLLNRYDHCWRWGVAQTPWYPTIKDVRQTSYGVWDDVVENIRSDLRAACDKIAA